jgi:hypothetical protein
MTVSATPAAVAVAASAAVRRRNSVDHLAKAPVMLPDIDGLVSLGMANAKTLKAERTPGGEPTLEPR